MYVPFFTDKLNCECAQNAANSFAKFNFIALGEEGGEWGVGGSLVSFHPAKCLVPLAPLIFQTSLRLLCNEESQNKSRK